MVSAAEIFLPIIRELHESIRGTLIDLFDRTATEDLSAVARDEAGDTIYAIDVVSEELIVEFFERNIESTGPIVLIAEGLKGGSIVLPEGATESDAQWRVIVDPIDGTRGLMFQKRSGWILTGVAPNRGPGTSLADIEFAMQTEIPVAKQYLSDVIWAGRGRGVTAERFNKLLGEAKPLRVEASRSTSIAHGFASVSRFIPGVGVSHGEIYESLVNAVLGPVVPGKARCFEDQYISTGGQLYELIVGHDTFVADLRPLFGNDSETLGLCCHPYDLCTELIARELGVIVTDEHGRPPAAVLSVEPAIAWVGYANEAIRRQLEQPLMSEIAKRR